MKTITDPLHSPGYGTMQLILTGGSGMVGYGVLQHCLASKEVTKLSIISRRDFALPTGPNFDTSKARVIVHKDYTNYPAELLDQLKGAHGVIWAQGISQRQVNAKEYTRITYDYPLAGAKAFASLGDEKHPINFVYVSGEGADMTENSWVRFCNVKGRAEKHLLALPASPTFAALRMFVVRPSIVDPGRNAATAPGATPPPSLQGLWLVRPIFQYLIPSHHSPTPELSRTLVDVALCDGQPLPAGPGIEHGGRLVRSLACRTAMWESIFHSRGEKTQGNLVSEKSEAVALKPFLALQLARGTGAAAILYLSMLFLRRRMYPHSFFHRN